jgi:hypothetical protein
MRSVQAIHRRLIQRRPLAHGRCDLGAGLQAALMVFVVGLTMGITVRSTDVASDDSDRDARSFASADSPARQSPHTGTSAAVEVEEAIAPKVLTPTIRTAAGRALVLRPFAVSARLDLSFDCSQSLQAVGTRIQI